MRNLIWVALTLTLVACDDNGLPPFDQCTTPNEAPADRPCVAQPCVEPVFSWPLERPRFDANHCPALSTDDAGRVTAMQCEETNAVTVNYDNDVITVLTIYPDVDHDYRNHNQWTAVYDPASLLLLHSDLSDDAGPTSGDTDVTAAWENSWTWIDDGAGAGVAQEMQRVFPGDNMFIVNSDPLYQDNGVSTAWTLKTVDANSRIVQEETRAGLSRHFIGRLIRHFDADGNVVSTLSEGPAERFTNPPADMCTSDDDGMVRCETSFVYNTQGEQVEIFAGGRHAPVSDACCRCPSQAFGR